jgi:aspartate aminotransferase
MLSSFFKSFAGKPAAPVSAWGALTSAPADPILGLNDAFKKDTDPKKVLLGMGAYRDDDGKPFILPCVKRAEELILERNMDHEYSAIHGIDSYVDKCLKLAYGADSKAYKEGRIAGAQSISGTGSLRLGLTFFKDWYPHKDIDVLVPDATWPIHRTINDIVGNSWKPYRYYDSETKGLNFEGLKEDLNAAKDHSMVMFHVCAHNPTGVDPNDKQWEDILEIVKRKNLYSAFDSAYQGFASGDLERDAYSLKLFQEHTDDIMLFQSFAKNFGLYGERAGCFSVVCDNKDEKNVVMSRIKQIARPIYSNPPIHGARIVDIVLGDEKLTAMWHQDLKDMSGRMHEMRHGLVAALKARGNEHDWSHVTSQIGMFAFTGLNKDQVNELREKWHIYMTMDGRISIAGLNTKNLEYIADGFHSVTAGKKF